VRFFSPRNSLLSTFADPLSRRSRVTPKADNGVHAKAPGALDPGCRYSDRMASGSELPTPQKDPQPLATKTKDIGQAQKAW
jgi:hypothetical protein